ncbi:hypothetical protein CLCR_06869 [Cladophialophora carrionii]|uniref:C3H1-type domain-containing protein n=1 Tax=Cladophialophora carrionii TaxID=86049 RepID=A0A1C1CQ36_9EURO|nr:hypothetical protein CLCR_06869 [Cladophialophora carrionii]
MFLSMAAAYMAHGSHTPQDGVAVSDCWERMISASPLRLARALPASCSESAALFGKATLSTQSEDPDKLKRPEAMDFYNWFSLTSTLVLHQANMPGDGGYTNSTGVDYSPPSPAYNSSGPSRPLTPVAHDNSSPASALKPATSVKEACPEDTTSQSKIFDKPPPTAPRSMRQNTSPPPQPLRRVGSYRDATPHRSERSESYRPCQSRYGSDLRRPERAPVANSYQALSPHRPRMSWADYKIGAPSTDVRYLRYLEDALERCNSPRTDHVNQSSRGMDGASLANSAQQVAATNPATGPSPVEDAVSKEHETVTVVGAKARQDVHTSSPVKAGVGETGQDTTTPPDKHGSREDNFSNRDYTDRQQLESRAQEDMQKGLGLPQPKTRLNESSRHDTYPSQDCRPSVHPGVRDDVAVRERGKHPLPTKPPQSQPNLGQQMDGMAHSSTSHAAHLHNSTPYMKSHLSGPSKAQLSRTDPGMKPFKSAQMVNKADKYKQITCPSWNHSGCRLIEAHCIFAHKTTGRVAPRGNETEAKDFTCPRWREDSCTRQTWEYCPARVASTPMQRLE